jgi:2-C-methyl-D-erythritol 2,4-cyclodiphosphate synthase
MGVSTIVYPMSLVGLGYDSHRFTGGRPLVLGGVRIEHTLGLAGHSDADALLHAIIDAILGAAGLGDIGEQFPDTDERYRDADSTKLLEQVIQWITKRGLSVTNVDATVITQAPKLAPYKMAMRQRIAFLLGLEIQAVSVKAKTNEGMGWIGSGEGLAVVAVVMLGKGPADLAGQVGSAPEEVPLVDRPMPTEPVGPPALPIDGPAGIEGPSREEIQDIEKSVPAEICFRCGAAVDEGDVTCGRCGTKLRNPPRSQTGCSVVLFVMAVSVALTVWAACAAWRWVYAA